MSVDRYALNDALTELAQRFNCELDDDTLNELTHHVADVMEGKDNRVYVKLPLLAVVIDGPTGPERVIEHVTEDGTCIKVWDTLGREFIRTRADEGWWVVIADADSTPDQ